MPAPELPDLAGTVLDASVNDGQARRTTRLRLLDVLGTGGCATVYRAVDLTPGGSACRGPPAHYAVKCTTCPPARGRANYAERLANEQAFHTLLSAHPHVVTLHDVRHIDALSFFVFDYVPGGNLFQAIVHRHEYYRDDERVRRLFLQLVDAVIACHERSVFHRDLKPENILLSDDGRRLYLTDFGLATCSEQTLEFNTGTTYYMSPECLNEDNYLSTYHSASSDVWALGVVLLNMLTGRLPWSCARTDDLCFAAYLRAPEAYFPRHFPLSPPAAALLVRLLAPEPAARPALREVRAALRDLDTFFLSERDIARASAHVRAVADDYRPVPRPSATAAAAAPGPSQCASATSSSSSSSDSDYGAPLRTPPTSPWAAHFAQHIRDVGSDREDPGCLAGPGGSFAWSETGYGPGAKLDGAAERTVSVPNLCPDIDEADFYEEALAFCTNFFPSKSVP